jgi:ketosteroid isomerase-like protein
MTAREGQRERTTMTVEDLLEIESIRKLRGLYSYYLDAGELAALLDLFAEDAVCEFGPYGVWEGKATIARNYEVVERPTIEKGPFQTLHANTNHWIELTGADTAVGRVYLIDFSMGDPEKNPLVWLGVYDEAYRKVGGAWKIARSSLQFMWPQQHLTPEFPGQHLPIKT